MEQYRNSEKETKYGDHSSNNPQIIPLTNLLKKGIVYEEVQDFEHSIYNNVYLWAKEAVEQITADSRQKEKFRQSNTKVKNTETSNVISFIGRRGTGKSSAMLSFQEALKKYRGNSQNYKEKGIIFSADAKMENVRFFTLDCIDAAAMEKSESVFTLVLANMLSKIQEFKEKEKDDKNSYLMRSLLQKLGDIYKGYRSLSQQHDNEEDVYSAYESLKSAANSQSIRAQFGQLVRECLQYFQKDDDYFTKEAYLVIAIDDLDMAHYNERAAAHGRVNMRSYEIMREISKYFSIPGVIVLAAYNHTNLQRQCSGFFIGSNSDFYRNINQKDDILRHGETLAGEFMEKTFASAYRLYMPSWKKWDYFNWNIRIDIGKSGEDTDLLKRFRDQGRHIFKIKELLEILFAEKTGVFYDCEGKKRHFLEVDSLRALNSMLYLLIGEDALKRNDQNHLVLLKENRKDIFKRVMDDVYFRFVNERLYREEEKALFYELLELQIDRRSERIVQLTAPKIEPLGRNIKQKIKFLSEKKQRGKDTDAKIKMAKDNSNVTYNYAELLHCIYHMTRKEKIYSKEFVACLLHSYSVCLTQIYDRYQAAKHEIAKDVYVKRYRYQNAPCNDQTEACQTADLESYKSKDEKTYDHLRENAQYRIMDEDKEHYLETVSDPDQNDNNFVRMERNYQILKGVIGKTVFGYWTEYYFPVVKLSLDSRYPDDQVFSIGSFKDIRATNFHAEFHIKEEEDISRMLNECIFLMTFYIDILQWKSIQVRCETNKYMQVSNVIMQCDEGSHFELTSFVKFSILYPDYLYKMEQLLTEAFDKEKEDSISVVKFKLKVREKIQKLFEELWDSYYTWDMEYGGMILPIHNLDLMYNLVKHLFHEYAEQKEYISTLQDGKTFLDEFETMLYHILKHLRRTDLFYCLEGTDSFVEKFQRSPFIRMLGNMKKDKKSKKFIGEYINYISVAIYNDSGNRKASDEF